MDDSRDSSQDARTLQILCGALMMGMLTFGAIAIFLVNFGGVGGGNDLIVPAIMAGFGLMTIPPTQLASRQVKLAEPPGGATIDGHIGQYRAGSIIGWAGLEGASFANLVAYIIAGQGWSLIVPGLCLVWMAATFPTEAKLVDWLRQREQLADT